MRLPAREQFAPMVGMLAMLALVAATGAQAQTSPKPPTFSERWPNAQAAPAAAKPVRVASRSNDAPVNLSQALYLIRSTLITLNDANRSGNYSVLRDLAAPAFQARNTPADLSQSFADLRSRRFDLFAAALIAPQLSAPPGRDPNGMLRLTGHFPTRPLQIRFDMLFQDVDHQWRLFAISVQTPQAPPQQVAQPEATRQ